MNIWSTCNAVSPIVGESVTQRANQERNIICPHKPKKIFIKFRQFQPCPFFSIFFNCFFYSILAYKIASAIQVKCNLSTLIGNPPKIIENHCACKQLQFKLSTNEWSTGIYIVNTAPPRVFRTSAVVGCTCCANRVHFNGT